MVADALSCTFNGCVDIEVVGVASDGAVGIDLVTEHRADVVILDSQLPHGQAIQLIPRLVGSAPSTRVLMIGSTTDTHGALRALEAGAAGFLLKDQPIVELIEAVRTVHAGGTALSPRLITSLANRLSRSNQPRFNLTPREVEVLALLADGLSTADLSQRFGVSIHTIRNHVQSVLRRLGAHSKLEAVAIARREGLIPSVVTTS